MIKAEINKFTLDGLEAFLASGYTKGIGKVFAKKIVEKFGEDILNQDFDFSVKLKEIPGLGENKINEFVESINSLKVPVPLMVFLFSSGLKDVEVEKIVSHYGKRLEKVLIWDPYDMVENVWKLSFFTADKIGRFLNIPVDDPRRLRGAILTAVKFYAEEGNMFATEAQALQTASRLSKVEEDKIKPEIETLIDNERIIKSLDGLYLPVYFKAEEEAAEKIKTLIGKKEEIIEYVPIPEKDIYGNKLNEDQRKAIETVLKNKVTIITGGPGTGKTTTVKGIINLLLGMDKKVVLAAPTGRAAKRMSDLTGEEAKTIHRLLGYSMGRGYKNKHFDTDILVIDEASMLEQVLFNHLLQALKDETKVVLVGDTDQLPAIGAGNVLNDMIESGEIPVINLTENFRQREGSLIAANASAIKDGELPDKVPSNDFIFVEEKNTKNIHDRLLSLVSVEIPSYTGILPKDIQVVTPQQEGPLGAKQLNIDLQERINPNAPELKRGLKRFRLGDRVMQTSNSSQRNIYNGEVGWISNLNQEEKFLEVTFNDGKKSIYNIKDLSELSLAYATTVHKLQGSETDYMVMAVTTEHRPMLYRNLLYTGISRAKKLCVIIGEEKALETAIANKEKSHRNSNFKLRLQQSSSQLT
ncbi:MAG: ATP-dependent RecD-like DNA helicase [Muribaculaceae bacterium]|nr:ATP-dependent RecD-like DNA helicase [Muribaculaceae bacterium]